MWKRMRRINGERRELPAQATVETAVHLAGAPNGGRGVAVALDGEVVPRGEWASTEVRDGQELEVLRAAAEGLSAHETAARLVKSHHTITTQRRSIEAKLGAKESQLAAYVAQAQGALQRRESEWWTKQTGRDGDEEAA